MSKFYFHGAQRTLCEVLDEMRDCIKTLNFSYLNSLIEEAQVMGNRMEAGLGEKREVKRREKHLKELKKDIKDLEEKLKCLEKEPQSKKET